MDKVALSALVQSLVRWALAFVAGLVGFQFVETELNTVAAFGATLILAGVSLWWSKLSDKKVVAAKAGGEL
jgi:hypothetical protein